MYNLYLLEHKKKFVASLRCIATNIDHSCKGHDLRWVIWCIQHLEVHRLGSSALTFYLTGCHDSICHLIFQPDFNPGWEHESWRWPCNTFLAPFRLFLMLEAKNWKKEKLHVTQMVTRYTIENDCGSVCCTCI